MRDKAECSGNAHVFDNSAGHKTPVRRCKCGAITRPQGTPESPKEEP